MTIHTLDEEDLPSCVALFARVFDAPSWNETWDVKDVKRRLDECWRTPGFLGLMIKSEALVVGFAVGHVEQWDKTRHFYLKEMCVVPAMQRCGVGTELMRALEDHLRELDVNKIVLHTARDSNAQAFYARCGFGTSTKMVMMSKWLTFES